MNLKSILETKSALVTIFMDPISYKSDLDKIISLLKRKAGKGVYISITRPIQEINKLIDKNLILIDMITKTKFMREGNKIFLNSPQNLVDLSIVLNEAFAAKKANYFILDSLNSLLLYNNTDVISRFAHFLYRRIKDWGILGIVIVAKGSVPSWFSSEIYQFSDSVVDLSKR